MVYLNNILDLVVNQVARYSDAAVDVANNSTTVTASIEFIEPHPPLLEADSLTSTLRRTENIVLNIIITSLSLPFPNYRELCTYYYKGPFCLYMFHFEEYIMADSSESNTVVMEEDIWKIPVSTDTGPKEDTWKIPIPTDIGHDRN
jgi:hypothetical protein